MNRLYTVLFIGMFVLAGCVFAGDSGPTLESPTIAPATVELPRQVISLSISLYLLVDDKDNPDPEISTHRTEEGLREILEGMNDIWIQAGIRLELQSIESVQVPEAILQGMLAGKLGPFFREIDKSIAVPQASIINGFYLRSLVLSQP